MMTVSLNGQNDAPREMTAVEKLENRLSSNIDRVRDLNARLSVVHERAFGPIAQINKNPGAAAEAVPHGQLAVIDRQMSVLADLLGEQSEIVGRVERIV